MQTLDDNRYNNEWISTRWSATIILRYSNVCSVLSLTAWEISSSEEFLQSLATPQHRFRVCADIDHLECDDVVEMF